MQLFFPDNFNAEPRFRISSREGRDMMIEYEFPGGITKSRLGVKVIREANLPGVARSTKRQPWKSHAKTYNMESGSPPVLILKLGTLCGILFQHTNFDHFGLFRFSTHSFSVDIAPVKSPQNLRTQDSEGSCV